MGGGGRQLILYLDEEQWNNAQESRNKRVRNKLAVVPTVFLPIISGYTRQLCVKFSNWTNTVRSIKFLFSKHGMIIFKVGVPYTERYCNVLGSFVKLGYP